MKKIALGIFMVMTLIASPCPASEIDEVISASPSWDSFTNKDGTGLYHEVLRAVFSLYGIPVRHTYSKSNRSEELVLLSLADMMTCDDKATPPLVLARYPMYENDYYVFFKKSRIGPWRGEETLRGMEILSQPTFYSQANFNVPVRIKDVLTGEQALSMIILDRSDFYVDDLNLIRQSMRRNTIPFRRQDFDVQKAGRRAYFPLFNVTERGKHIKRMYEEGIVRLHRQGKLKPIYDKWDFQYPDFDSY
ncbi:ABC transporter substrate-binding protein [Pseudodesulfovibrio cashew]|uniref:ABC transporter substrate-binding protein n=1 Tax=Pseudodesulfovibrio cashew TaxID=2678688 RepID=A0A6I6JK65_9BACT|nr:ABC transporter substrate-binding protein [Pseudodesulfovibrio cashew]QGY40702.1 ABC transporter substrate-binding protein [Pseudodesulfovibrio cashew]